MERRRLLPLLLPVLMFGACTEHQPPTAPVESGGMAEEHTPGHKVVNSLADPGNGACNATQCTLREAINDPGSTEISFAPGLTGPITLASPANGGGQLQINKTLSITGPSQRIVIRRRSTDPDFRIFRIGTDGTVTLSNLVIRGGKSSSQPGGGGISNTGTLRVINSVITGNSALNGGGIFNRAATLRLTDSRISNNSAGEGGGIDNNEGVVTLIRSTVSGNSVRGGGGGIENSFGTVTLTNSTVTGNTAIDVGGGIHNFLGGMTLISSTVSNNSSNSVRGGGGFFNENGRLNLTNSTVSGNSVPSGGGGGILSCDTPARLKLRNTTVAHNSANSSGGIATCGPLTLTNSLVARNTAPHAPDVFKSEGVTITARFSLLGIGNGSGVSDGVNGNQVGSESNPLDPLLGPLAANGGPTATHRLLPGSPAIDAASTPDCPPTDQRGVLRPQGAACDIGSFERIVQ